MNLPKLKVVFIFFIITIINGKIVNWKKPMSLVEKKNVLARIRRLDKVKQKMLTKEILKSIMMIGNCLTTYVHIQNQLLGLGACI